MIGLDTPLQKFVWKRGQITPSLVIVKTREDKQHYKDDVGMNEYTSMTLSNNPKKCNAPLKNTTDWPFRFFPDIHTMWSNGKQLPLPASFAIF